MSVDARQMDVGVQAETTLSGSVADAACTHTGGGAHCARTPRRGSTASCTSSTSSSGSGGGGSGRRAAEGMADDTPGAQPGGLGGRSGGTAPLALCAKLLARVYRQL